MAGAGTFAASGSRERPLDERWRPPGYSSSCWTQEERWTESHAPVPGAWDSGVLIPSPALISTCLWRKVQSSSDRASLCPPLCLSPDCGSLWSILCRIPIPGSLILGRTETLQFSRFEGSCRCPPPTAGSPAECTPLHRTGFPTFSLRPSVSAFVSETERDRRGTGTRMRMCEPLKGPGGNGAKGYSPGQG